MHKLFTDKTFLIASIDKLMGIHNIYINFISNVFQCPSIFVFRQIIRVNCDILLFSGLLCRFFYFLFLKSELFFINLTLFFLIFELNFIVLFKDLLVHVLEFNFGFLTTTWTAIFFRFWANSSIVLQNRILPHLICTGKLLLGSFPLANFPFGLSFALLALFVVGLFPLPPGLKIHVPNPFKLFINLIMLSITINIITIDVLFINIPFLLRTRYSSTGPACFASSCSVVVDWIRVLPRSTSLFRWPWLLFSRFIFILESKFYLGWRVLSLWVVFNVLHLQITT